jgi:hypothetical protein
MFVYRDRNMTGEIVEVMESTVKVIVRKRIVFQIVSAIG